MKRNRNTYKKIVKYGKTTKYKHITYKEKRIISLFTINYVDIKVNLNLIWNGRKSH